MPIHYSLYLVLIGDFKKETHVTQSQFVTILFKFNRSARGFSEDLKLGRQIGKLEAEQIVSHGKLISSLLQDRLSRKQRDEEMFSARLACHYINNRWWDLLSPSSNIPLPSVRGSARGA